MRALRAAIHETADGDIPGGQRGWWIQPGGSLHGLELETTRPFSLSLLRKQWCGLPATAGGIL